MNWDRDQIIKGVVIGILALIALGLLSNLFGGSGPYSGPGYYGHGGGEGGIPYGYTGGGSISGLLSNILSLLITLMAVILVVSLALGAYKVAWPQLNAELANFLKSAPKSKCVKCGKELAADWQLCPYCGTLTQPVPEPAQVAIDQLASAAAPEPVPEKLTEADSAPEVEAPQEIAVASAPVVDPEPANRPTGKKVYPKTGNKKK